MKEIGEALKEARENIGITLEEAANDLKLKTSQIENIEAGNKDAFDDIFHLKYFIRDYAKYLGLNYEDLVDDFNEFLFDYTSRISLDDIKKARKQVDNSVKNQDRKVVSPYTYEKPRSKNVMLITTYILIFLLIVIGVFFIMTGIKYDNENKANATTDNIIK